MKFQFELWRLIASVALFGLAFGALRAFFFEVHYYGTGLFPHLCLVAAFFSIVAACGMLFRKVGEFLLRALLILIEMLDLFW